MHKTKEEVLTAVEEALQEAEELGGPEGEDYFWVMNRVQSFAENRTANYKARLYERKLEKEALENERILALCAKSGRCDPGTAEFGIGYHGETCPLRDGRGAVLAALDRGYENAMVDVAGAMGEMIEFIDQQATGIENYPDTEAVQFIQERHEAQKKILNELAEKLGLIHD